MPSRREPERRPARRRPDPPPPRGDGWWPPTSTPIPVEGGLQARSRRGAIGDTWWSQRFIAVLESFGMGSRLQRGKRYARTGQVVAMDIGPGRVTGSVQGSRTRPYRVFIEARALTESEWDAVESAMASNAAFVAPLLAGEMPHEIETAFAGSSGSLFPASVADLDTACSCPDWENPCKHIAAVFFLLAEAFDDDPFLIFAWRGRNKKELLASLRARRRRAGPTEGDARPDSVEETEDGEVGPFGWPLAGAEPDPTPWSPQGAEWWGRPAELAALEIRPRRAVAPDLVLRQLDAAALGDDGGRIIDGLRPLYEAITAGAAAFALGEEQETSTSTGTR
jgi:uncharacterized Zn finger protein